MARKNAKKTAGRKCRDKRPRKTSVASTGSAQAGTGVVLICDHTENRSKPVTPSSDPVPPSSNPVIVSSEPVIVSSEPVNVLSEPVNVPSEPVTCPSEPVTLLSVTLSSASVTPSSEPMTRSPQAARPTRMKVILLVSVLSGIAAVGGGAVTNWQAIEVGSRAAMHKVADVSGAAMQKVEDVSEALVQKTEDASAAAMQKVEGVSGAAMQKAEVVSGALVQKAEDVSEAAIQKIEDVSGAAMQKVEVVSGAAMQKVEDVSDALVQKAENVSEAAMQKVEDVSGAAMQKVAVVSAAAMLKVEGVSVALVRKVGDVSEAVMQKAEVVSGAVRQKVQDFSGALARKVEDVSAVVLHEIVHISGALVQKVEDVSGATMQKAENVSVAAMQKVRGAFGAVVQKVENVSGVAIEKVEDVSGGLVQKASAAVDSWQEQPVQATADFSHAIVSRPEAPPLTLVERSVAPADVPTGILFGVGDRLKVVVYERVDVEEDKWGSASSASALRGILQRPELSGEYAVQEDGTISVPLLGSIPVANRSTRQVQTDLLEAFEHLIGRKGLVNILSLERSPIYVLGPVKNPGAFKYAPGMTILHAIALAGGLERHESEPWQKIEAVREIQKRSAAVEAMLKLVARAAVLKAERDGTPPKIPRQLLELASATEAANLVNEQSDRRKPVATARKYRERATLEPLETAKQEVVAYGSMESLDQLVKMRQERVNGMRKLVDRKILSMTVMHQAQGELADAQQRQQDALNRYAMAKQRLASLESEAFQIRADLRNELEVEIETTESQIEANARELNASESVLYTLAGNDVRLAKDARPPTYQIVRQSAAGPVIVDSVEMTLLQPGDLVNIIVGDNRPRDIAGSPGSSSSPTTESLPGLCTSKDAGTACAVAEQKIGPN